MQIIIHVIPFSLHVKNGVYTAMRLQNTLLKKIQALKKEKENLALNYEQEEECLTNDLSRKLDQVENKNILQYLRISYTTKYL